MAVNFMETENDRITANLTSIIDERLAGGNQLITPAEILAYEKQCFRLKRDMQELYDHINACLTPAHRELLESVADRDGALANIFIKSNSMEIDRAYRSATESKRTGSDSLEYSLVKALTAAYIPADAESVNSGAEHEERKHLP